MNDFSATKEKILRLRNCGIVHISFMNRAKKDPLESLLELGKKIGLSIQNKHLKSIEKGLAMDILNLVLKQDLAYSSPIMPSEQADVLTRSFCDQFEKNSKFFTNGSFEKNISGELALVSWDPITEATFDTGVFIIDEMSMGCLWVEDED